jgi:uncharacterized SAM-binding protein YcdF (DUF218 family)
MLAPASLNSRALFLYSMKRVIKFLVKVIVIVIVADAVFVWAFPNTDLPDKDEPADAVIVLGAAPNSPAIRNRASLGYQLYTDGQAKAVILSGGKTSSKDESEAMNMARFLTKDKPASAPLVLEEKSANTYENLKNSKQLVPDADSVIIVSDSYHLPRAFLVAKSLGFEDVYWDSPKSDYYKSSELWWYYAREVVAVLAYTPRLLHW